MQTDAADRLGTGTAAAGASSSKVGTDKFAAERKAGCSRNDIAGPTAADSGRNGAIDGTNLAGMYHVCHLWHDRGSYGAKSLASCNSSTCALTQK